MTWRDTAGVGVRRLGAAVRTLVWLGLGLSWTTPSLAQDCLGGRPTDPAAGWSYGTIDVESFAEAGGRVRVWYAIDGAHAAPRDPSDAAVPQSVRLVSRIAEEALSFFETDLGYRAPLGDEDYAACAIEGADARLDVYLFDFGSADGTVGLDRCLDNACSGFVIIENDFDAGGYESFEQGVRTVLPHELFHLVQAAYAESISTWWSEATAQWATKQLYSDLTDLESFLPVFFDNTDRPIDLPPGGAAQAFSYATAIFPTFLGEAFEPELVRQVFERLAASDADEVAALDLVLAEYGSSLADAFSEFAVWNGATGERAGSAGYRNAAAYPEVPVTRVSAVEESASWDDTLAGLAARYYFIDTAEPLRLELEVDAEAIAGWFVPDEGGALKVDRSVPLPLTTDGAGMVVVAGQRAARRDVAYALSARPPESSSGGAAGCAFSAGGARDLSAGVVLLLFACALGARTTAIRWRASGARFHLERERNHVKTSFHSVGLGVRHQRVYLHRRRAVARSVQHFPHR